MECTLSAGMAQKCIRMLGLAALVLLAGCQAPHRGLTPEQVALLRQQGFQPVGEGWALDLNNKVLFGSNKSTLTPDALRNVQELGRALISVQIRRVRVDGHTDSYGQADYNDQLSLKRAETVADVLQEAGMNRALIETRGLGDRYPVADNRTAAGAAENRRVAIVVPEGQ